MSGSVDADVNVGPIDLNINGLDNINIDANADLDIGLDNIHLSVDEIKADVKARLTLDEIKADLQASLKELAPIFFNFLWKEIPIVKIGFPHRYRLGFHVCGKELFAMTFCGESEVITEKNPCGDKDTCGEPGGHHG